MPTVTRSKKAFGAAQVYSEKRRNKIREEIKGEDQRYYRDNDPRFDGDNGYHTGQVYPLIEDDQ